MKKLFLIVAISMTTFFYSEAQEIGVRFGDVSGGNVAIDAKFSRLHVDVSFGDALGVDALWDFIHLPIGGKALKVYAGFGPYARFGDPFEFGVVGELGLEHEFKKVPIVIGADWRPGFRIIDNTDFIAGGFGINIRYRFGL